MNPTARASRRMQPGAYLSKGADPSGSGVLNKREQSRADASYKNLGLASPAEQRGVPNNPRNFDSHSDANTPVVIGNLYGDWQKQMPQTHAVETTPTPAAAGLVTQPWQTGAQQDLENGIRTLSSLQAQSGPSPAAMPPNEWVMSNQPPGVVEGISGYEAAAQLPAAPMDGFDDIQHRVHPGAQLPFDPGLDLANAPYTVTGNPSDSRFPAVGQLKTGKGKPASMPKPFLG